MNYTRIIALLFISHIVLQANAQKAIDTAVYQPSVLIENFSSEGCSSCPEGDKFTCVKTVNITVNFRKA